MAEKTRKSRKRLGRYYVDHTCIDCDLCRETGSCQLHPAGCREAQLRRSTSRADPAEEAACLAALEECPVEAIGNDGAIDDAGQVEVSTQS